MVLVLTCLVRLGWLNAVFVEHPADSRDVGEDAVEHLASRLILIEALADMVAQIAAALARCRSRLRA